MSRTVGERLLVRGPRSGPAGPHFSTGMPAVSLHFCPNFSFSFKLSVKVGFSVPHPKCACTTFYSSDTSSLHQLLGQIPPEHLPCAKCSLGTQLWKMTNTEVVLIGFTLKWKNKMHDEVGRQVDRQTNELSFTRTKRT